MTVNKTLDGDALTVAISGRVDTVTAPQLEAEIKLDGVKDLTFDFADVEYVSSAGLRLLVKTYKAMSSGGGAMKIANIRPIVKEVFDITGFADRFTFV